MTYRFPDSTETPTISPKHSPLINQLLAGRGITDAAAAELFLNPSYDEHLHDPDLLHDIDAACARIQAAIEAGERIAIFADYDCDGIPGAVVLHDFFKAIEYDNFTTYIPHRHFEGFGLSTSAVDKLTEDNVQLIITIDCGTSNVTEIAHANKKGIDVIVTDHHEAGDELPQAVAIVNPKLGEYPFGGLCGAAVVFKLVQSLLRRLDHQLPLGREKWWLDMVGIATIADMVPLIDENRVLARYGLTVLRKSRRPGLQQLLKKNRANQRFLTEDDVGFTIGPRINAASRMDTPEDAFQMLAETDIEAAAARVKRLEELNTERKTAVALMTRDLHKRLKNMTDVADVLVLGHPDWKPSLAGLAANKLAEEYGRPAFIWGTDGNGKYKGSCRAGGGVSVVEIMKAAADIFTEYGGHHASGGFTVKDEHIFTLGEKLNEARVKLGVDAVIKKEIVVDAELSLTDVNQKLINDLADLAPFGHSNHKPIFAFKGVTPRSVDLFGKTKEHTKLIFETDFSTLEAIAFFATPEQFTKTPSTDTPHTLLAHVEESFFMGRRSIRLRIIDIL